MDYELGKEAIQGLINQELKEIIRLQHLIQSELDELVEISKFGGSFHVAIKEGEKSVESLANIANIPLGKEIVDKFKKIKQNMDKNLLQNVNVLEDNCDGTTEM